MVKFLHISDIHLGIKRYGLEERTVDFFRAWRSCLEKYAIDEKVDFVLIGGDLFDRRQIDPQAANHAIVMLERLKAAGISVFAIEGNHDQRETGSSFSWLRSLSKWRFLHLLEPDQEQGQISYLPWDEKNRQGGYIDFQDVRIFGSRWYGVTTNNILSPLYEAIRPNLRSNGQNILLLHTEVEGQLNRPIPAVSASKLLQLKDGINYLALGHIHKNFAISNWAFNPGSLEAATVDEYRERRGAYLVELVDGKVTAQLVQDYSQRPFDFLELDLSKFPTADEASKAISDYLIKNCPSISLECSDEQKPLVEVILQGHLSFKSSLLKLESIKSEIKEKAAVLEIIFRNETVPNDYAVAANLSSSTSRADRELQVLKDLVAQNPLYKQQSSSLANLILEMKRLTLTGESPEKLLELLQQELVAGKPNLEEIEQPVAIDL
jgi:DNA repair exonuclease SbcCD nuclease subunit